MSEQDPLLVSPSNDPESGSPSKDEDSGWKERTGRILESQTLHKLVILFIIIDSFCVLADLAYTLLDSQTCAPDGGREEAPDPAWLEMISHVSLAITTVFLIEIPLQLWAFGVGHYNPWENVMYGWLHLFDAAIIITTFVLEVALKGREKELAGLLILFRLWRLVKLVGGVAVGAGEIGEEDAEALVDARRELEQTKAALADALENNRVLRQRLGGAGNREGEYYD